MSFWSGETLAVRLPTLITPYDPRRLDCASYQLSVGDQAFVTSDKLHETSANPELVTHLGAPPKDLLRITPGQFAFVLTQEDVEVPANAIALISMRATYKFKGLINVSGFTVDPGWQGKLLFSLYNAGPTPIILHRDEPVFVIVYASLDRTTAKLYNGASKNQKSLKTSLISNLNSQVFSPQVLKSQLEEVHRRLGEMLSKIGIVVAVSAALAVITTILIATVALLPSWVGVVIARSLDAANYEIRQKPDAATSSQAPAQVAPGAPRAEASRPASAAGLDAATNATPKKPDAAVQANPGATRAEASRPASASGSPPAAPK